MVIYDHLPPYVITRKSCDNVRSPPLMDYDSCCRFGPGPGALPRCHDALGPLGPGPGALVGAPGPCGPGPCGLPWARVGRALVGSPGPLWAGPLWAPPRPCGPGPCGPPWALVGPLGPCRRLGRCGPPWALVVRALVGPLGACGPPWALVGPLGPCWLDPCGLPGPL